MNIFGALIESEGPGMVWYGIFRLDKFIFSKDAIEYVIKCLPFFITIKSNFRVFLKSICKNENNQKIYRKQSITGYKATTLPVSDHGNCSMTDFYLPASAPFLLGKQLFFLCPGCPGICQLYNKGVYRSVHRMLRLLLHLLRQVPPSPPVR